jgi:hypothetical protein
MQRYVNKKGRLLDTHPAVFVYFLSLSVLPFYELHKRGWRNVWLLISCIAIITVTFFVLVSQRIPL